MITGIIVAQVVQNLLAISCLVTILQAVWQYKERKRSCTLLCAVSGLIFSGLYSWLLMHFCNTSELSFEDAATLLGFISAAVVIGVPQIILKVKKPLRVALLSLTVIALSEMVFGLYNVVAHVPIDTQKGYLTEQLIISAVYLAVFVLFRLATANKELSTVKNVVDSMPRWIFVLALFLSFTAYCTGGLREAGEYSVIFDTANNILFVIAAVGIMFCCGYFMFKIFALSYQQTQILKQLSQQHDNYENMLKSDEQLRQFRHDYKNHMIVVTALLNSGKTDEASDYLDKIKIMSGLAGRQFSTGNFVVDAILNNKNSLAEEFEIHIQCSGTVPESGIDNSDLCTVVSNLIDNAIEGTKRFEGNRYVKFESFVRNGFVMFSVSNPVNSKVQIKNNRIATSKSDAKNHGIGLRNVEKTAEKYNGRLLLDCTDREFTADVNMKLYHGEEQE